MRLAHFGVGSAVAAGAFFVLAGGCSSGGGNKLRTAQLAEGCLINTDCESPLVCAFRRCHVECTTSRDCEPGQRCLASDRPFRVCQLEDERLCNRNSDCPAPLLCGIDGECRDQCAGDRDCVTGQVCTARVCAEPEELVDGKLPPSPNGPVGDGGTNQPCLYNSECPPPLLCRFGQCALECLENIDCSPAETCVENRCVPPGTGPGLPAHCTDGQTSGDETDADCGGSCPGCPPASNCTGNEDCTSGLCNGSICQQPSCADGVRNGSETGVDCGGATCDACTGASPCLVPSDCSTGVCQAGSCRAESCADGLRNGSESDVDCGGADCAPCDHTRGCGTAGDCRSRVCAGGTCQSPTCNDAVANGDETGIDCGGASCGPCGVAGGCGTGADCQSGVCTDMVCQQPNCSDSVANGAETDVDCGGLACDPCTDGQICSIDGDCASGSCAGGNCSTTRTLTVVTGGSGAGSITSSPAGINCGAQCSAPYSDGATVTLTAAALSGSTFAGWSGAGCSGTGTCIVTLGADETVTANFSGSAPGAALWTKVFGGATSTDTTTDVEFDATGNVIAYGDFFGTSDFGGGPLMGAGNQDVFMAKYSPSGAHSWSRRFGTSSSEAPAGIALDSGGNVYAAARTPTSGAAFGAGVLACGNNSSVFGRFASADGDHVWSGCMGPAASAQDVAVDSSGNLFVVGSANGTPDFGDGPFSLGSTGEQMFVAKYASGDGSLEWVVAHGSVAPEAVTGVVVDSSGDAIIVGRFSSAFDLGAGLLTSNGQNDIFVAKLSGSDGATVWSFSAGDTFPDLATDIAIGTDDEFVVTGYFDGTVDFGGSPQTSLGNHDIFVAKYGNGGEHRWSNSWGTSMVDEGLGVAVGPSNEVALTGSLHGPIDFGGSPVGVFGSNDVFAVKLDANGGHLWSLSWGSTTPDEGYTVALDGAGAVALGGEFTGMLDFGTGPITPRGPTDAFLTKLSP